MKNAMPAPMAAVVVVITVGVLGFLGWFFFLKEPPPATVVQQATPLAPSTVKGEAPPIGGTTGGNLPAAPKD
jgi:hypothetical protein